MELTPKSRREERGLHNSRLLSFFTVMVIAWLKIIYYVKWTVH